jgi:hypothetical protein
MDPLAGKGKRMQSFSEKRRRRISKSTIAFGLRERGQFSSCEQQN